ncbi:MAG TPA: ABC transporter ATP-binding protein, partial [Actinomycetota bacterium]|nr:ABC transporter ATP-binding protein [Actinomycetota bacterium]
MTVEVMDLTVAYDGRPAVQGVTVAVRPRQWLGLIGPNGAGKTTLLRAVAGLLPFVGQVRVAGSDVAGTPRRRLAQLVAYVPQRPELPGAMTVTDYVLLGRTPYIGYLAMESERDLDVVADVLDRLDLAGMSDRTLGSLSGGEGQRAVLARALAQQAPILLLDEPTAALDVGHQQHVLNLVDELRTERGLTILSAMHDLTLAGQFADGLILVNRGRVVASGPAKA